MIRNLIVLAALVGVGGLSAGAEEAPAAASQASREVALADIYTSSGQEGTQTPKAEGAVPAVDMESVRGPAVLGAGWAKGFAALKRGAIVKAKDGKIALAADGEGEVWVVVYFGSTGSRPVQFLVDKVTVSDKGIEIAYKTPPPGGIMTMDLRPYFAWVPVGKLAAGKYDVRITHDGKAAGESQIVVGAAKVGDAGGDAKGREIPLGSIHTSSGQEGTQRMAGGEIPDGVRGADAAVVGAAFAKEVGGLTKQTLAVPTDAGLTVAAGEGDLWLVVYLGSSGSRPPQFLVDRVSVNDGTIEVVYKKAARGAMTKDLRQYIAWIPAGPLPAGKYAVRVLHEGELKSETALTIKAGH